MMCRFAAMVPIPPECLLTASYGRTASTTIVLWIERFSVSFQSAMAPRIFPAIVFCNESAVSGKVDAGLPLETAPTQDI
ncbi:hypothetical protein DKG74_06410 [Zavarzinia aquatilis]|uniref:Uncharacterized protein n=1 Tax=Zavarzinia aquatilis TaxID=2211142 RepID=A0A317EBH2_9PROT|nr:hypothetical protein DKG74_06410 [Zavarzinia aquatilis]